MTKMNINKMRNYKRENKTIVWVTAYDYPQARIAENAGVDMILVGDSAGNTTHGHQGTLQMDMPKMLTHSAAVAKGSKSAFLVGDMPYMSYQASVDEAVRNAGKFIRAGMDSVKLEGYLPDQIRKISEAGILVCGHLGLTPQSVAKFGGYRVQGKTEDNTKAILNQARHLQSEGMDFLLLEAMPPESAGKIASNLSIPVYGIGAGNQVDGQLVIFHDLVGLSFEFTCKFVKKYVDGEQLLSDGLKQYTEEVRTGIFPGPEHFYEVSKQ